MFFRLTFFLVLNAKFWVTEANHICTHLVTGHLDKLHLKSFAQTRPYYESDLLLFESDQVYWIARDSITPVGLPLQEVSYGWNSDKSYYSLKNLKLPEDSGEIVTVSLINKEAGSIYQVIVVTEKYELMYDWKGRLLEKTGRIHGDFSLVTNEFTHGYVLQVDQTRPRNLVIYDFNYTILSSDKPISTHIRYRNSTSRHPRNAYYLYRADNAPNSIRFVYPPHLEEQQALSYVGPLFDDPQLAKPNPPPPGFIHKNHVYLFDVHRGCVYIFAYNAQLKSHSAKQTSFLYPRINVPFEHFFGCSKKFLMMTQGMKKVKLDELRCQVDVPKSRPSNFTHPSHIKVDPPKSATYTVPLLISGTLLVAILFSGIIYMLYFRQTNPALGQEWTVESEEEKWKYNGRRQRRKRRKRADKRKTRDSKTSKE